jgi:hypothetical protein
MVCRESLQRSHHPDETPRRSGSQDLHRGMVYRESPESNLSSTEVST